MEFTILDNGSVERLVGKLKFSARRSRDTDFLIAKIVLDMMRIEKEVFASQGRRGGGSWKRLAEDTVRRKGSEQILRTSGAKPGYSSLGDDALYNSLIEPGAPFQILRTTKQTITFGTSRPYAGLQQSGGSNLPARPFLRFTVRDTERWRQWLAEHVLQPFTVE